MKTLTMIRHSETDANARHLYYGSTDLSLNAHGIAIANALNGTIKAAPDSLFADTGLKRTTETLNLLFGDVPHLVFPELREMSFGIFEMKSYEMLKDDDAYQRWITDSTGEYVIPNGESTNAFHSRVLSFAEKLPTLKAEHLLIVAHGGSIATLMQHFFPDVNRNYYEWLPKACRGYMVRFEENTPIGFDEA